MLFMNDDKYFRSVKELEQVGCKWWPKEVRDEAMKVSILQYLLDTQEEFISLLTLADNTNPEKLFKLLEASDFEYHLFLKHLMVLTDVGSEPIQRLNSSFKEVFPGKKLEYEISGKKYSYNFTSLPLQGKPTNARMQISTIKNLQKPCKDKKLCKDLIILLIYGASAISLKTRAILYKCKAFEYLGKKDKIMQRVRRNYIPVSYSNEDISNRWPISKWLLRTVLDNLCSVDDENLEVNIGESIETLDRRDYKQLQKDLIELGYSAEEVCRGFYDEYPRKDNMRIRI